MFVENQSREAHLVLSRKRELAAAVPHSRHRTSLHSRALPAVPRQKLSCWSCDRHGQKGPHQGRDIIRIVQERLNSNLKVGGIVITQFDRRKTLNRSVREIVNDSFHEKVFKTVIRDNVALAEAPINGKTIFEYNPKSNGASDYMSLAKEVLNLK